MWKKIEKATASNESLTKNLMEELFVLEGMPKFKQKIKKIVGYETHSSKS